MYRQTFYSAFKTLAQTCLFNGMFCFNKKKKKSQLFLITLTLDVFGSIHFKKKTSIKNLISAIKIAAQKQHD